MTTKPFMLALVFTLISFFSSAEEMRTAIYPQLQTLSIVVPDTWESYDKRIYGIESPNREVEIAGRVFNGKGKTLEQFTKYKHGGIAKRMTWYQAKTQLLAIEGVKYPSFIQEYEGVWPEKKSPTTYIVTTFKIENYYLSLTFTGLTENIAKHRDMINSIIRSVKLANSQK